MEDATPCDCGEELNPCEFGVSDCGFLPAGFEVTIGSAGGSQTILGAAIPDELTAGHFRAAAKALRGHHVRPVRAWLEHIAGYLEARAAAK